MHERIIPGQTSRLDLTLTQAYSQGSPNSWRAAQPWLTSLRGGPVLPAGEVGTPLQEGERRESMWDPLLEVDEVT